MDSVKDLLNGLNSELGVVYSLGLLVIGLTVGALFGLWVKKPIQDLKSVVQTITKLEDELEGLVKEVSKLWERTTPTTIRAAATGEVISYQTTEMRWWRRLLKLKRNVRENGESQEALNRDDIIGRLQASSKILKSQTVKVAYLIDNNPFATSSRPQAPRAYEAARFPVTEDSGDDGLSQDDLDSRDLSRPTRIIEPESRRTDTSAAAAADLSKPVKPTEQRNDKYLDDGIKCLIDLYNSAITDSMGREQFREHYQPTRIGTVNAVERRQNPTTVITPQFRETTDGDFFAFELSAHRYAVTPRLGLTVGAVSYNAGALGEMFGNPNYDPAQSYSRYRVLKPAIFKRDGDRWELIEAGRLDLGAPD